MPMDREKAFEADRLRVAVRALRRARAVRSRDARPAGVRQRRPATACRRPRPRPASRGSGCRTSSWCSTSSSFDISAVPGVKVPAGYQSHFRSFDGKERTFLVEGAGGPTWYTEYNVLSGLSARSFGHFAEFVTRIAAGRVTRSLPNALHNCGYRTYSVYPWLGAFLSARNFQKTLGIDHFYDAKDLKTRDDRAGRILLRLRRRSAEARSRAGADVRLHLPDGQPFSLDLPLSRRTACWIGAIPATAT